MRALLSLILLAVSAQAADLCVNAITRLPTPCSGSTGATGPTGPTGATGPGGSGFTPGAVAAGATSTTVATPSTTSTLDSSGNAVFGGTITSGANLPTTSGQAVWFSLALDPWLNTANTFAWGAPIGGRTGGNALKLLGPVSDPDSTHDILSCPTPSGGESQCILAVQTGTGSVVRATSPTLVTPALGTPTAIVLTNATGLPSSALPQHIVGSGTAPACAVGVALNGGTCTFSSDSTDLAGEITLVTGAIPTTGATLFTITWNLAYTTNKPVIMWSPTNAAAAGLATTAMPFYNRAASSVSASIFTSGTLALGGVATFTYNYVVIGPK